MSNIISFKWLSIILITAAVILAGLWSQLVLAQTIPAVELDGYAWSDTIGWISFNCKTGGPTKNNICATKNYNVSIKSGGAVEGYAWSDNIGWIKFHGLSGFPTGSGTYAGSAQVTGTYPNLTFRGWARACAGMADPVNCTGSGNNPVAGGWDGWISLGGTSYSVKMGASGIAANSWAWGSDIVGWIDMYALSVLGPTATLTGTGCTIPAGASTCNGTFSWSFTNAPNRVVRNSTTGVDYGTAASATNAARSLSRGNNTIVALDGTTLLNQITVAAQCVSGTSWDTISSTCKLPPPPPPTLSIGINPSIVRYGDTALVEWTISSLPDGSCSITGPGTTQTGITTSGSVRSSGLTSYSTFTISCVGTFGEASRTSNVEVIPRAEEI